ncbi:hypothetical protein [Alkaliphilus transvaalensis]|uniref:hypothetical protein n=1 Tax=Alkaliphilus transvaalensis TaxID=114628 RepID=UPI00047B12DF|nr:hypothetical protein [Alkaliphilus transvaalensis]
MMIPTALYPISSYIENLGTLSPIETPKTIGNKKRLFSKGQVNIYKGDGISKLVNLSVKGMHLYHYDFGMVYPEKDYVYPIFFYQVIIAPKRVLVLTHYAFSELEKGKTLAGIEDLTNKETQYEELFIKEFKPQSFIEDHVLPNKFNGLIRTTDIDKAYEAIASLLEQWHTGLLLQGKSTSKEEMDSHQKWFENFRNVFYKEDYGFLSTKRYLGESWTKEVFERYLFDVEPNNRS